MVIERTECFLLATSRYQACDLITSSTLVPVRITLGRPRFSLGYRLGGSIECLYPDRSMLAIDDAERFESAYRAQLDQVGARRLALELALLSHLHGDAGLVLLCFEDVTTLGEYSCHRRTFARWWEECTGQVVPELTWDIR